MRRQNKLNTTLVVSLSSLAMALGCSAEGHPPRTADAEDLFVGPVLGPVLLYAGAGVGLATAAASWRAYQDRVDWDAIPGDRHDATKVLGHLALSAVYGESEPPAEAVESLAAVMNMHDGASVEEVYQWVLAQRGVVRAYAFLEAGDTFRFMRFSHYDRLRELWSPIARIARKDPAAYKDPLDDLSRVAEKRRALDKLIDKQPGETDAQRHAKARQKALVDTIAAEAERVIKAATQHLRDLHGGPTRAGSVVPFRPKSRAPSSPSEQTEALSAFHECIEEAEAPKTLGPIGEAVAFVTLTEGALKAGVLLLPSVATRLRSLLWFALHGDENPTSCPKACSYELALLSLDVFVTTTDAGDRRFDVSEIILQVFRLARRQVPLRAVDSRNDRAATQLLETLQYWWAFLRECARNQSPPTDPAQ